MNTTKKAKLLSTLCVLAAGILWGIIGLFVRALDAAGLTSLQKVAARIVVTAVIMLVALSIFNRPALRVKIRDLWCFLGTGLISIVVFSYCYFTTIEQTSLSVAAVLLYTAPVLVTMMSAIFFGDKITAKKLIGCALAVMGCALVTGFIGGGNARIPLSALVTGLISAFGYALYSIFGRAALDRGYSSYTVTAYTFFFACAGILPLCDPVDMARKLTAIPADSAKNILLCVGLGVFTALLPYILYTKGLSGLDPSSASIMASVEPVVATLTGIIAFGEPVTALGMVGVALVVSAIAVMNLKEGSKAPKATEKG